MNIHNNARTTPNMRALIAGRRQAGETPRSISRRRRCFARGRKEMAPAPRKRRRRWPPRPDQPAASPADTDHIRADPAVGPTLELTENPQSQEFQAITYRDATPRAGGEIAVQFFSLRTSSNLLILRGISLPITGFQVIGNHRKPVSPRKPVFPITFDRFRQFQPKIGQARKKWLKLRWRIRDRWYSRTGSRIFWQAISWRVWRQGRTQSCVGFDTASQLRERLCGPLDGARWLGFRHVKLV